MAPARAIIAELFGPPADRSFAVRFWDGSVDLPARSDVPFTIVVRRPGALRRMLLPPSELSLAEAYLRNDVDIEGPVEAASALGDQLARRFRAPGRVLRLARALRRLPSDDLAGSGASHVWARRGRRAHSRRRDAAAVRFHYDVSNEFYQLWLDRRMQYSCAYFATGHEELDAAQEAKLEHICRKLRLRPGERLLDVGCGWGGLLEYAGRRYGIEGVGITLSEHQAVAARERLAAAGLGERCRIELRDYRDLPTDWRFDKAVSVGMREHVGAQWIPTYFAAVYRVLAPGGVFLDHGIVPGLRPARPSVGERIGARLWRRDAFISRYVFPDGELVPLPSLIKAAEDGGFETRDVETLREHYALTLRAWVRRLEAARVAAIALVGEPAYRVWRLYMAATALRFTRAQLTLAQTLYAKPAADGSTCVPLTRRDLYRGALDR